MGMQTTLTPVNYQNSISLLEDFLAKVSALQDIKWDSMTQEELSFLKSQGFSKIRGHNIFYSKMLGIYYLTMAEIPSTKSLKFLPTWGMCLNGRYITAKITKLPNTEKGYILEDILLPSEEVPQSYYLSKEREERALKDYPKEK